MPGLNLTHLSTTTYNTHPHPHLTSPHPTYPLSFSQHGQHRRHRLLRPSYSSRSSPLAPNQADLPLPPSSLISLRKQTWGHTFTLAESIAKGINASGAQAKIYQFAETLPAEVLEKMYAAPKPDYPVIKAEDLKEFDGYIFAFGTR